MGPARLRLATSWDAHHTLMTLRLSLPRAMHPWEVMDLCAGIRAWTGRRTRIVLPAEAPCDWLDDWSLVLSEAVVGDLEVEFALDRRDGRRR
jgi:hypothetical protein